MSEEEVTFRRRSRQPSAPQENGYMPVDDDDDYTEQTGIRGRRSCCLCVVISGLFLIAMLNAVVVSLFIMH